MRSTVSSSEATAPPTLAADRAMILVLASMGGFLVTFMASAINVALRDIGDQFHLSAVYLSWLSLSTVLVSAAVLLPFGRLADLHGRVRFFVWGMGVFAVASLASAFAPSAGVLLGLRMLNGVSLAIGSVTAPALVILAYPLESRGRALGISIAGVYLGLTLGPVLGGLIVQHLGWRNLFLITGIVGTVNVGLPLWKLRHLEWREPKQGPFDVVGSIVYAGGLTAVLLGFSFLPKLVGILLIVGGLAGLALFLRCEGRAADPLLPVDLLRGNRVFTFSNTAVLINYAATAAMIFLMGLYLEYNRGLNAQTAGFVLVSGSFVQAALSPVAGWLADRMTARYVASVGMGFCALGLFALIFLGPATPFWYIVTVLCVLGLGFALFSTPVSYVIVGSVPESQVGAANATQAGMRLSGQSMSIGIATMLLAVFVGGQTIHPGDYPHLLTAMRVGFLIFTVMCVIGVGASLVGPKRGRIEPGSGADGSAETSS